MKTIRADRWLVGVRDPRNGRKTHHFDLIIRTMEQESSAALTTETHAQDGQETRIAGRKRESTPYRLVSLRCRHQSFTVRGAGIFCFKKLGQFRTSDWLFSYVYLIFPEKQGAVPDVAYVAGARQIPVCLGAILDFGEESPEKERKSDEGEGSGGRF